MDPQTIFSEGVRVGASDIFVVAGRHIIFRVYGMMQAYGEPLKTTDTQEILTYVYQLAKRDMEMFNRQGDDDFSFSIGSVGRFRVNAYKQRGSLAAVIRVVKFVLPNPEEISIPKQVIDLSKETKGLVLVTGPASSGKSTTLGCVIDAINHQRAGHIITLEDPIEFMYKHDKSIVSQREIGIDTPSYIKGLRAALRESPDVILLGEMRDLETISVAMTAAETGQLVFSSLHTLGVANTIDRIIDVFPPNQQHQVRVQLSMVLKAVIAQQLIPTDTGVVPAFEIMYVNAAIRTMIRESKVHQIDSMVASLGGESMQTMDSSLIQLVKDGRITKEQAKAYSLTPETITRKLTIY